MAGARTRTGVCKLGPILPVPLPCVPEEGLAGVTAPEKDADLSGAVVNHGVVRSRSRTTIVHLGPKRPVPLPCVAQYCVPAVPTKQHSAPTLGVKCHSMACPRARAEIRSLRPQKPGHALAHS